MKKLVTYIIYTLEYLKYGDLRSVYDGLYLLLFKKSSSQERLLRTSIGLFHCRKGTNDFQFANYRYEWGVKKVIIQSLPDFDVFIDAGACIGDYTILVAGKGLRCHSFEPLADNFNSLQKNLSLNKLTGMVKTYNLGLGEKNETVKFIFDPVNTGASHIVNNDSDEGLPVQMRTLDSLIPEMGIAHNDKVLIKLDVEGMETRVIKGAINFLATHENVTLVLEDKISGFSSIKDTLDSHAVFSYSRVDESNFYARKTGNIQ